jgi:menaquinone-9 beta-reductase
MGFRTSLVGHAEMQSRYAAPVSFGIRRCEFDHYLLRRCGAELRCGEPVSSLRRTGNEWIINETISTPVVIGAGGHFCPAARWLNPPMRSERGRSQVESGSSRTPREPVVAALEVEVPLTESQLRSMEGELPVLRFYEDLSGYGWCFRKETFLNIGVGRVSARGLPQQARDFLNLLIAERLIPEGISAQLRGHAYLLASSSPRQCIGDGILLAGDAAGLADPHSGEGIRPAIESGLLAARAILAANGRYDRGQLEPYRQRLRTRFRIGRDAGARGRTVPAWLTRLLATQVMRSRWLTRHLVLDRWFLGRHRAALN